MICCHVFWRGLGTDVVARLSQSEQFEKMVASTVLNELLGYTPEKTVLPWFFVNIEKVGGSGEPFCCVLLDGLWVTNYIVQRNLLVCDARDRLMQLAEDHLVQALPNGSRVPLVTELLFDEPISSAMIRRFQVQPKMVLGRFVPTVGVRDQE